MLPIIQKINEFVEDMIVEYDHNVTNFERLGDEEDQPEEEKIKKRKVSDLESYPDNEVEPKMVRENDPGLHLWPPSVPK